jgi:hypothetical protein
MSAIGMLRQLRARSQFPRTILVRREKALVFSGCKSRPGVKVDARSVRVTL